MPLLIDPAQIKGGLFFLSFRNKRAKVGAIAALALKTVEDSIETFQ